jgi:drug/metabolite transporter (DMT)-like permease
VAVAGVGLLTGGDGSEFVAGDAVCILSAVIFGYHTLTSSKYARLFEDQELPFISLQIGVVAAESGLWKLSEMWYRGGTDVTDFVSHSVDVASNLPWPALLWMGLATTSFTLWIEFLALKNVSASTCALIYTAEPLWGALFAWHFMGDRWGPAGWLGATLVVGASVGSQLLSTIEEAADSAEGDSTTGGGPRGEEGEDMYTENFSRY